MSDNDEDKFEEAGDDGWDEAAENDEDDDGWDHNEEDEDNKDQNHDGLNT